VEKFFKHCEGRLGLVLGLV